MPRLTLSYSDNIMATTTADQSLPPFVSRKDRPEHQKRRTGTGRPISSRNIGVLGRHTGVRLPINTVKDLQGFDDVEQALKSDSDGEQEDLGNLRRKSSLFPLSPASVSTAQPELGSDEAIKRLEFQEGEEDRETSDDDSDGRNDDRSSGSSENTSGEPSTAQHRNQKTTDFLFTRKNTQRSPREANPTVRRIEKPKPSGNSTVKKQKAKSQQQGEPDSDDQHQDFGEEASFLDEIEAEKVETDLSSRKMKSSLVQKPVTQDKQQKRLPKKKRRQTLMLVEKAQETGIGQDFDKAGGIRRSGRARCKPVNFFECEQINYKQGAGGLFSIDSEKAVIRHVPTPIVPSRHHRQKRRRPKSLVSDDENSEDEAIVPLSGEVVIRKNGKERSQVIAARSSDHSLVRLKTKVPKGITKQGQEVEPLACKLYAVGNVSAGVLQIPPLGTKYKEKAAGAEVYFVNACQRNCLVVTVNRTELKLSKGDSFVVPDDNSYSICNTSKSKRAELFFTVCQ